MNYGKRIASLYMLENPIHYKKCYCFDLIIRKMVQGHAHGLALDCIIMKLTEKKKKKWRNYNNVIWLEKSSDNQ